MADGSAEYRMALMAGQRMLAIWRKLTQLQRAQLGVGYLDALAELSKVMTEAERESIDDLVLEPLVELAIAHGRQLREAWGRRN